MAFTQLPTGGGVPNVDLITQTLAKLQPDSALQNYARMHKNDPYILSLATAESNRRKALRTAAQGQVGQQPTVVDQKIAGMATPVMTGSGGTLQTGYGGPVMTGMASGGLPEDQGIAQLPTPNMQRMADGGIAGYGDDEEQSMATGGMYDRFNFAHQGEPVVRMSGGGAVQKFAGKGESLVRTTDGGKTWTLDIPKTIRDPSVPYYREIPNPAAKLADMKFPSRAAALEAATTASTKFSDAPGAKPYSPPLGAALPTVSNTFDEKDGTQAIRLANQPVSELAADRKRFGKTEQTATFQGSNDPIVPRFQPGVSDAPAPAVAAAPDVAAPPTANPPAAGGVTDLFPAFPKFDTSFKPVAAPTTEDATKLGSKFTNLDARTNTINSQVAQKRADITNAAENRVAALQAFNEKQGPAYAGYEKLLQKEELQDTTDKEKAGLTALFKGFLAIAAGESPNAATNIAKGSMVGLEEYSGAMKEFKKSAKERNKEMQNIQQARRAEERGNFDKAEMYEYQAEQNRIAATDAGIAAISKVTDTSAAVSAGLYSDSLKIASDQGIAAMKERGLTARSIYEQSSQNARSLLPTGDARTAIMLGSGKTDAERLKSGMGVLQELSADKTGMAAFKILGEINAKNANDPNFKPLTLADLTAFQRDFQRNMQAGPKNVSDKPTGKVLD
jgi:hypothetical protein